MPYADQKNALILIYLVEIEYLSEADALYFKSILHFSVPTNYREFIMISYTPESVSDEVKQLIHFDTLLAVAMEALDTYSIDSWSNRTENDSGLVLLQSIAYSISDLCYRHTLPLSDLLTTADQGEEGLFPLSFGPQTALTCTPVTENDYRRLLLNLHSTDLTGVTLNDQFLFKNIQLIKEPEDDMHNYYYNSVQKRFLFYKGNNRYKELKLYGGFSLLVAPNRGVHEIDVGDEVALFLQDYRNLCEGIRHIIWLEPFILDITLSIEVKDDFVTSAADLMAKIFIEAENLFGGEIKRASTVDLQAEGIANEDIYEGPHLSHGWINVLPDHIDYTEATHSITITPLVNKIYELSDVKTVSSITIDGTSWEVGVPEEHYALPWGESDVFTVMCDKVLLFKRGEQLDVLADDVQAAVELMTATTIINEPDVVMTPGKYRSPDFYYPTGKRLPECYGLQLRLDDLVSDLDADQLLNIEQLHRFTLVFEQLLANGCDHLSMLPELLSFGNRGINYSVWGGQWPFTEGDVANSVHADYINQLKGMIFGSKRDAAKELAIVDYLLGYFNSARAELALLLNSSGDDFNKYLRVQQGFLSRYSEIAYEHASIRIDKISAVQKRIAAKLGIGPELFRDESSAGIDFSNLPFYVVEHRAILPEVPNTLYTLSQDIVSFTTDQATLRAVFTTADILELQAGNMIDLTFLVNSLPYTIKSVLTTEIKDKTFTVDATNNERLENYFSDLANTPANDVQWKNSNIWLFDMRYLVKYSSVSVNELVLKIDQCPVFMKVGDPVIFERDLHTAFSVKSTELLIDNIKNTEGDLLQGSLITGGTVTSIDKINREITVMNLTGGKVPPTPDEYIWYIDYGQVTMEDRFSFIVSVVFNFTSELESTAEQNIKAAWFEQVVREEFPPNTIPLIHWLEESVFDSFAALYADWHNNNQPLGDKSYGLMTLLSIGMEPNLYQGVSYMHVFNEATDAADGILPDNWWLNPNWSDSLISEHILDNEILFIYPD